MHRVWCAGAGVRDCCSLIGFPEPLTLALAGPYSSYSSGLSSRPTSAICEMCLGFMD